MADTATGVHHLAIGDTIFGRQRLDAYEGRVNRAMAEHIERVDGPPDQRIAASGDGPPSADCGSGNGPTESPSEYQQRIMDDANHQRDPRIAGTPVPTVRGGMRATADADSTPP